MSKEHVVLTGGKVFVNSTIAIIALQCPPESTQYDGINVQPFHMCYVILISFPLVGIISTGIECILDNNTTSINIRLTYKYIIFSLRATK